jgi:hypothetical protein
MRVATDGMPDTLGLLEESRQLARDLGYEIREEPLGDLPGGPCRVGDRDRILLNIEHAPADQLAVLIAALANDPRVSREPTSRLLAERLAQAGR